MTERRRGFITLSGFTRFAFISLAAAMLVLAYHHFAPWLMDELPSIGGMPSQASRIARRSIVYRIDAKQPTTFRFSQPVELFRLVYQPVLAEKGIGPRGEKNYALRAELLAANGQVIARHEIYSRSVLYASDGNRMGPYRFYRNDGGIQGLVAIGDEALIASRQPVAMVRLVRGPSEPGVLAVDLKVYERRPLIDQAAELAFYRYSPEEQQALAGSSAFHPELLTREERIAIARNQWRPVGPIGIEGRDYRMMVLYESVGPSSPGTESDI